MPNKVTLLADMPDGTFEKLTLHVSADGLESNSKRHLYDNGEKCVFPVTEPFPLDTLEQIKERPDIPMLQVPEKWMMLGEFDGMYPYSTHVPSTWEEIGQRQQRNENLCVTGLARASAANARAGLEHPLTNVFVIGAAAIAGLMVIVAATAMLLNVLGDNTGPEATGMLPLLLGAVAVTPKRRKKKRLKDQWSVFVFDTIDDRKLHYSLPFSEIQEKVPQWAWRSPSLRQYKWMGLGLGLATPIALAALLIKLFPVYLIFTILGAILLVLPCALLGFKLGPWFMRTYAWWCRPHVKMYLGQGSDGELILTPVEYTNLTGISPSVWQMLVREKQDEYLAALEEAMPDEPPVAPSIEQVYNRASEAWNYLYSPAFREYANRIPLSLAQKLQIGSLIALTVGTIGLSFFIVMATQ